MSVEADSGDDRHEQESLTLLSKAHTLSEVDRRIFDSPFDARSDEGAFLFPAAVLHLIKTRSLIMTDRIFAWLILVMVGCLTPSSTLHAQDPPMQWGEISKADLAMTSYPKDTSAAALVLCDYGQTSINDDLGLSFARHIRVKIFTPAGYSFGSHYIEMYTKDRDERIINIEGASYSLRPDSTIEVTKLDDDEIFEEKESDEYTMVRMTLPNLRPGCIVEFHYEIKSDNWGIAREWKFQTAIPTRWSEYRLLTPEYFEFATVTRGYEPFFINAFSRTTQRFRRAASAYMHGADQPCNLYRWAVRDAPAIHEEPYITTLEDYTTRVRIQLSEYATQDGTVKRVLSTWPEFTADLLKEDSFGGMCSPTGKVRRQAEAVTAGLATAEEKINAIYDFIRNGILWNGEYRLDASHDLNDVLETRKGSSAEVTFLFLAMLHAAGIEAEPVIVGTRSHGRVSELYPIIVQFNDVLARVHDGQKSLVLDPTDPLRPPGMLPREVLNVRGVVIKEGPVEWVSISTPKRYIHRSLAKINLKDDGSLGGVLESMDEEYSALAKRRDLREKGDREVAKELFGTEKTGLAIDSVSVEGRDSSSAPLHLFAHATSSAYVQRVGEYLYVNPMILDRIESNPLKRPERKYPVDMSYCTDISAVSTIAVPEGYDIKETPRNVTTALPNNSASFSFRSAVDGRRVETVAKLVTSQAEYPADAYARLRDFYTQIVAAESGQIVLQRHVNAPPPVAPAKHTSPGKKKGK